MVATYSNDMCRGYMYRMVDKNMSGWHRLQLTLAHFIGVKGFNDG